MEWNGEEKTLARKWVRGDSLEMKEAVSDEPFMELLNTNDKLSTGAGDLTPSILRFWRIAYLLRLMWCHYLRTREHHRWRDFVSKEKDEICVQLLTTRRFKPRAIATKASASKGLSSCSCVKMFPPGRLFPVLFNFTATTRGWTAQRESRTFRFV